MRLLFDHGTLVLAEAPDLSSDSIPGLMWDPRVGLWRAPAFRYADVLDALRRRRLPVRDEVPASLRPNPEPFRPIELHLNPWKVGARSLHFVGRAECSA